MAKVFAPNINQDSSYQIGLFPKNKPEACGICHEKIRKNHIVIFHLDRGHPVHYIHYEECWGGIYNSRSTENGNMVNCSSCQVEHRIPLPVTIIDNHRRQFSLMANGFVYETSHDPTLSSVNQILTRNIFQRISDFVRRFFK